MFAIIETNNATHIAIHIPHAGADKTLPALAAMLEQNAVFIRKGYQDMAPVKPSMSISLGDKVTVENYDVEIVVAQSSAVIGEGFVHGTPDILVNNAKALKRKDEELSRLRTELSFSKQQLEDLKEKLVALDNESA